MNTSPWERGDTLARALHLRVNESLNWADIATILGMDSADAPRIKLNREMHKGVRAPHPNVYAAWDWRAVLAQGGPENAQVDAVDEEDLGFEVEGSYGKNDYAFDGFAFHFPVNGQLIRVEKVRWEQILADYASQGGNLTQYSVASKHGFPKKILEACLRLYGHYKARPPVSREALQSEAEEPLVARAIEVAEHAFATKLEHEEHRHYRRRAEELEREVRAHTQQREWVRGLIQEALDMEVVRDAAKYAPLFEDATAVYHVPLYDVHLGMRVEAALGWGAEFNTEMAAEAIRRHGYAAAAHIEERTGGAQAVHYSIGGDFFHAMLGRTKKGTPLERDGNDRVAFRAGIAAVAEALQALADVSAEVILRVIPGNHDHIFAELLEETLAARFRNDPRIKVPNDIGKRKFFKVGTTMHLLDHGEGFTSFGPKALLDASVMARVIGGAAYHGVEKIVVYVGHTHHLEIKTHGNHLVLIRVPTISPASDYAEHLALYNEVETPVYRLDTMGRISETRALYVTAGEVAVV